MTPTPPPQPLTLSITGTPTPYLHPPTLPISTASAVTPLQLSVEGGSPVVAVLSLLVFGLAAVLSVLVTYRFVQGYRRSKARPILLLAVGMFLLAPAPMALRFVAGNVVTVGPESRMLATAALESAGLLTILVVIYGGRR